MSLSVCVFANSALSYEGFSLHWTGLMLCLISYLLPSNYFLELYEGEK